jgi:heat shock protein HtpX
LLRWTWFSDDDNKSGVLVIIGIAAAILAPIIAVLIQLSVSRKREYLADATGALTTRYPQGLESALLKIEQAGSAVKRGNTSTAHLYFANPLKGKSAKSLFSTHPPIADRIAKLKQMETSQ